MRRFSRKEFTQFGLTVSKFCRRFEISAPTISKMERGDPSVPNGVERRNAATRKALSGFGEQSISRVRITDLKHCVNQWVEGCALEVVENEVRPNQ
jgi:transcriptional regulator with XRE-family HTH domain